MKISGLVMTKGESKFFLKESILSFSKLCDQIVVIDDNELREDNGVLDDLRKELGDKLVIIMSSVKVGKGWKFTGAQRNAALKYCTGDWVWSFDADEVLHEDAVEPLREQLTKLDAEGVDCVSVQGEHYYWHLNKVDNSVSEHLWLLRLFKNNGVIKYEEGKEHGLPKGFTKYAVVKGVVLHHYGYVKNACFDLDRYLRNLWAREMHTEEYLDEWMRLRMTGEYPVRHVKLSQHPKLVRDKFKMERWNK